METAAQQVVYRFGDLILDLGSETLRTTAGAPVALRLKSFSLLRLLVENSGRLVTREAIMEGLWPNLFVTDDNITQCVGDVRRALGPQLRHLLRTLQGRGYLFDVRATPMEPSVSGQPDVDPSSGGRLAASGEAVAVVDTALCENASPENPVRSSVLLLPLQSVEGSGALDRIGMIKISIPPLVARTDKPSIAVLPFENISTDSDPSFIALGIAEDVITALSRYPSFFVNAGASRLRYSYPIVDVKHVTRQLGVRYILTGSLRRSGNHIRVSAQLVDAESGKYIWAERYDRHLVDILMTQDEIANAAAISVASVIGRAEMQRALRMPPQSSDAWGAYQRGLWHLGKCTPEDNALAAQSFERAITLEPAFGGGYRGLAAARREAATIFQQGGLREAQASSEALARRAAELDENDADARRNLGSALLWAGDHDGALVEIKRALEMVPNVAAAHGLLGAALIFSGRAEEGVAAVERCIGLDPHGPYLAHWLLWVAIGRYFAGEYEIAVDVSQRAIRCNPQFPLSYRWLAAALGQLDRTAEAREALQKAIEIAPGSFDMYVRGRVPWMRSQDHAHMLDGLDKAGWEG